MPISSHEEAFKFLNTGCPFSNNFVWFWGKTNGVKWLGFFLMQKCQKKVIERSRYATPMGFQ